MGLHFSVVSALFVCCIVLIYAFYRKRYRYWADKGVKGPKPLLIFGNMLDMVKNRHSITSQFQLLYERTKRQPYVGIYMFSRPALLVNDLETIKTVFIKDFAHFTDHGLTFDKETQPLFNHLFNLNGARWKGLRNKLTPAFTSSKMKYMFDTMVRCGNELELYLENYAELGKAVDIKEVMAKYTTNVITSCAFGVESDSFTNSDCEVRNMGRRMFDFNFKRSFTFFLTIFAPTIQKHLKLKLVPSDLSKFFTKMIDDTITHRERNNIERNDLMQLMIRIKNNESIAENTETKSSEITPNLNLTNLELAALAFGFFVGGFETGSTTLSFIFYELAKNQDVQNRLRREIDDTLAANDNEITYEALNSMTYMYQIIEETLRMHPPIGQLLRVCTRDYTIPDSEILINKGTPVFIPIYGIHMDPEIYPEPEKFNPDRFSVENKSRRNHFSFLTFGEGPRMCIGNRFAIMQIRIALACTLKNYKVDLIGDGKLYVTRNSIMNQTKNLMLRLTKREY